MVSTARIIRHRPGCRPPAAKGGRLYRPGYGAGAGAAPPVATSPRPPVRDLDPVVTLPVTQAPPAPVAPGVIPVEPPAPPPAVPRAGIELWAGSTSDPPWRSFLEATGGDRRGICVSREFPDRLRASLGPRAVDVYWLSNVGREGSIRPGDLEAISELFQKALESRGVSAIYLDGLEYLVRLHTVEKTLQFLDSLGERAKLHAARVWIPLNLALIDPAAADALRVKFPAPSSG